MELTHRGFSVIILVLSAITLAYIIFPLATIMTFLDPLTTIESLTRPQVWNAFTLSLFTATVSTSILCVFGIPFAYFLARYSNFRGKFIMSYCHYPTSPSPSGKWSSSIRNVWSNIDSCASLSRG